MSFTPDDHDLPPGPTIRTFTGRYIDLDMPTPDMICSEDIAHALSLIIRFGGHIARPYSVGEHSIHVAEQLWRTTGDSTTAFAGLIHDAAEAYLGDVVRPLKRLLQNYQSIEATMERAIWRHYNLPDPPPRNIKRLVAAADQEILAWEMAMIRPADWRTPTPADRVESAWLDRCSLWAPQDGER